MLVLGAQDHRPPAPLVIGQPQLFDDKAIACLGMAEMRGKTQVAELLRGIAGMAGLDAGQVQACHRALQTALPVQPQLAATLEFGKTPVTQ